MGNYLKDDSEEFFNRIIEALKNHQIDNAEKLIAEYEKTHQANSKTRLYSSLIQSMRGDYFGAITTLKEEVELNPTNEIAVLELAKYHYLVLELEESIKYCDQVLLLLNKSTCDEANKALKYKVMSLYALGSYDVALAELNESLKIYPDDMLMLVYKGRILNRKGYYSTAKDLLNSILPNIKDSEVLGHAYYVLAMAYHQLGQTDKSEALLLESASLNDEFGMRWWKLRMSAEFEKENKINKTKEI